MATPDYAPDEPGLLGNVQRLLDGLKKTAEGAILYSLIERGLKRHGVTEGHIGRAFVGFLYSMLDRYTEDPNSDPVTRVKVRMLKQRLSMHLPPEAGIREAPPAPPAPVAEPPKPQAAAKPAPVVPPPAPPPVIEAKPEPIPEVAPVPPPHREAIEEIEADLASDVVNELAGETPFAELVSDALPGDAPIDTIEDFEQLKQLVVKGLDELIRERRALKDKLDSATEFLRGVENDRRKLRQELTQARRHSLADSLTGLPMREAFLRQLDAEIARVKRYGFSLALALVDVDNLETINEREGREAGDAVLRCYGTEILGKFRTYDLVGRLEDDQFAVLFPNTQKDGALRALEKARRTAQDTYVTLNGRNLPLPGFSSVLTLYSPGEQPAALMKRAAEILDHAKQKGPDRMIVALPTG